MKLLPWKPRTLEGTQLHVEVLPGGALVAQVRHAPIAHITPEMMAWWFTHQTREVVVDGTPFTAFGASHPEHVSFTIERPAEGPEAMAPGTVFRYRTRLPGEPPYPVDVTATVRQLDATGFVYAETLWGCALAVESHTFAPAPSGGVIVTSRLQAGVDSGPLRWAINRLLRPAAYPQAKGQAWIRHTVETFGYIAHVLPPAWREARPLADAGSLPPPRLRAQRSVG